MVGKFGFGLATALIMTAGFANAAPQYKILKSIAGPDGGWDLVSFNVTLRRLYVSRPDGILALDVDSGNVTGQFAKGDRTHEALPVNQDREVLITNGNTKEAIFADAKTGAEIARLAVGDGPDAAALDPSTKLALVMNHRAGSISLINAEKRVVVNTVQVGGALELADFDGKGRAFVNVEDKAEIAVIDIAKARVTARYALKGCEEPTGIAYVTGGLLLSACANGALKIVDAASGVDKGTIAIGPRPDGLNYDAARGLAFVPSGGDGTLSVIDVKDPSRIAVVQKLNTAKGARTGGLDPKTGYIYLPSAEYLPPAKEGARPAMKPGAFKILVVVPAN